MKDSILPRTKFDWAIYADATFAGLSVLIPIPLVDLFFESLFKRRMAKTIAKRNGRSLPKQAFSELTRWRFGCWPGCLVWPVMLVLEFLKRLYRTVLYFLTVKSATDQLSYYWHRAFLLDFMVRRGDLDDAETAAVAATALNQVLAETTTSPLLQLAQQIISSVSHSLRTVWRWVRRRQEDEVVVDTRAQMERSWNDFAAYFEEIAERYVTQYTAVVTEHITSVPIVLHPSEDVQDTSE
ncbi:MAG: hypothetical protein KC419_04565 [Anaerolineales bacterium]|nr:hypothetical protein [Anaerolineales bacterium]MCA9927721.1 hypothetical protein [Anaerolineales bacterium]